MSKFETGRSPEVRPDPDAEVAKIQAYIKSGGEAYPGPIVRHDAWSEDSEAWRDRLIDGLSRVVGLDIATNLNLTEKDYAREREALGMPGTVTIEPWMHPRLAESLGLEEGTEIPEASPGLRRWALLGLNAGKSFWLHEIDFQVVSEDGQGNETPGYVSMMWVGSQDMGLPVAAPTA